MSNFKYDLGVVGLGYVGLPLAVESANEGLKVIGYDVNSDRVQEIISGKSPIEDISDIELSKALNNFNATVDPALLSKCQHIVISVPTPCLLYTSDAADE